MTKQTLNFLHFYNPTQGKLLFAEMLHEVGKFMWLEPRARYNIMIGSDSSAATGGKLDLVSVVAIHRIGNGGRYFWHRVEKEKVHTLRDKIYAEVMTSLDLAAIFLPAFQKELAQAKKIGTPFDFQIHVDIGTEGKTRDLITEVTGMVRAYGFHVYVKPHSTAASFCADRHVR